MDIITAFCNNQGKTFEQLSIEEKALLADILYDASQGKLPILADMSPAEIHKFKVFITRHGDDYNTLTDQERWRYQEEYFHSIHS